MPKLQKSGDVYHITVPKSIVKFKKWEKGDIIEFQEKDGEVVLRKLS